MLSSRKGAVVLATALLCGCAGQPDYRTETADPKTAEQVDLSRYQGLWYEIARYPNSFEDNADYTCVGVTAAYALRDDGKVSVTNSCRKDTLDGEMDVANGVARPVSDDNTRLKVRFAPAWVPFAEGDYWVLYLAEDYSVVLVGDPAGKYLWILSRTPVLDSLTLDNVMREARTRGYKTEPLFFTPQPPAN